MTVTSAQSESALLFERPVLWSPPRRAVKDAELADKCGQLRVRLQRIAEQHASARFASSLSAEDMVITDMILRDSPVHVAAHIDIFTLETGRLPAQTLALLDRIRQRYGLRLDLYRPDEQAVEDYVAKYGANGFYDSVQARQRCCEIRKVIPLDAALAGAQAWVTGQRRGQSVTRSDLSLVETDHARGIPKYNPLFDWSEAEVWAYIDSFDVPVNPLHYQGYPSIGCDPCTKAVRQGEDPRAGRWWWESQDNRECGLHVHK